MEETQSVLVILMALLSGAPIFETPVLGNTKKITDFMGEKIDFFALFLCSKTFQ